MKDNMYANFRKIVYYYKIVCNTKLYYITMETCDFSDFPSYVDYYTYFNESL